jgi:rfaE bifunctional protein kinase chain/domain
LKKNRKTLNDEKLNHLFAEFNRCKVLVVGDVMIDSYWWGKVNRISPEAPVPIVSVSKFENRLGGAGNVALNVQSLGAEPILCAVTGDDEAADTLFQLMNHVGLNTSGILKQSSRITTVKTRIIGNNHQMLRIDHESENDLNETEEQNFINQIEAIIDNIKIDVIILEDYNKGLLTEFVIESVIRLGLRHNIPVAVDPKKKNFTAFKNVSLFKPNLKELIEGLNLANEVHDLEEIKAAMLDLKQQMNVDYLMLTLSERGVMITDKNNYVLHFPAHLRDIADVSGAGDTVVSIAALCLALECNAEEIAQLSNLGGGLVCESVGVVPIDKDLLFAEAKTHLMK